MGTRKSMKLPIAITIIMIIIIIYLFVTLQQDKVTCEKTTTYDNGVSLTENITSVIDNNSISNLHVVKKITLPDKLLSDDTYKNSVKYSLENTLDYLGKKVKYNTTSNSVIVTIDVSKNEVVLIDNIDFNSDDELGIDIDTSTFSGDVITLKVGDKYSTGEFMKKLKNNSYTCR